MSEHVLTIEVTVEAPTRGEAFLYLQQAEDLRPGYVRGNAAMKRWQLAPHERTDLPSTTSTYSLATAAST